MKIEQNLITLNPGTESLIKVTLLQSRFDDFLFEWKKIFRLFKRYFKYKTRFILNICALLLSYYNLHNFASWKYMF